eukprot:2262896-Rhodomonas_salina.2
MLVTSWQVENGRSSPSQKVMQAAGVGSPVRRSNSVVLQTCSRSVFGATTRFAACCRHRSAPESMVAVVVQQSRWLCCWSSTAVRDGGIFSLEIENAWCGEPWRRGGCGRRFH